MRFSPFARAIALSAFCAPMALADDVFNDDVIVDDDLLCVGGGCANGEAEITNRSGIKLKDASVAILFDDISNSGTFPKRDWQLTINEQQSNGLEAFFVTDVTAGNTPFTIEGNISGPALYVEQDGEVGLGTSEPQQDLHILDGDSAVIRMEQDGSGGFPAQAWEIITNEFGLIAKDVTADTFPFRVETNTPTNTLYVADEGRVGIGLSEPEGILHTKGDGVQLTYFESGDGGPVQVRFRTDSENRRFLAVNNANQVKSQIIFLDDRINFTGATDSGPNLWLSIGPDGITSQGPTCGAPCDLTFDPEVFTVPPIAERAAYMWDNMHLPAIGPTTPDTPINLTEKMGGVIHELEVAHIYIAQQQEQLEAVLDLAQRQAETIADLSARVEELEER